MCGRFVIAADALGLQRAFDLATLPQVPPRYNLAPTQEAPVITNEAPREIRMFRWGLVPSWAKDISIGAKLINARSEGLEDKPSFRAAFRRRRCLVPVSGFYEWQAQAGGKQPMYIYLPQQPVFALAGLWEVWRSPDERVLHTFTIVTTDANRFMAPIHTRMPVIVQPQDYALWLTPGEAPAEVLRALFAPTVAPEMAAYPVSKRVNRPAEDDASLITPLAG